MPAGCFPDDAQRFTPLCALYPPPDLPGHSCLSHLLPALLHTATHCLAGCSQHTGCSALTAGEWALRGRCCWLLGTGLQQPPHSRALPCRRHNNEKTFLIWINEEDHTRVISMEKGGNMKRVFERFCRGLKEVRNLSATLPALRMGAVQDLCPSQPQGWAASH